MSILIQKLDSNQQGENGTTEFSWGKQKDSNESIEELLVQLNFQLTRSSANQNTLKTNMYLILTKLKEMFDNDNKEVNYKKYIILLYKMMGYTRDIIKGKGEYNLTHMMMRYFYSFFPEMTLDFVRTLVLLPNDEHPYGSWKDMKYLCEHCKDDGVGNNLYKNIIDKCCELLNAQLKQDFENQNVQKYNISLVSKWIPRENKKFGWLFHKLATSYYKEFIVTALTPSQLIRATTKCHCKYRQLISSLNKKLDTLQIKQCRNTWSEIDFNKITSISLMRQKNALLNKNKNGSVKFETRKDRVKCAKQFEAYTNDKTVTIKGKRISMIDFTKEAIFLNSLSGVKGKTELNLLNRQWEDNKTQNGKLGKMIAMVDTSGSMNGDPMHSAIGLGIRIAEMSSLGKRVMTFSSHPTWVNLENEQNFSECVNKVSKSDWGMNTNFFAAMDMILNAIVKLKMHPSEANDMVLVILSDMQINQADNRSQGSTMFDTIKMKYHNAGMHHYGEPLKPPHILFWNLRSTSGFPNLTTEKNTSMMSGINPALMNVFCEEGMESLSQYTPWNLLEKTLNDKRYSVLQTQAKTYFK
jgi:hypothetical protein